MTRLTILMNANLLILSAATLCPTEHSEENPPTICTYFEPFNHSSTAAVTDYINIAKVWQESWSRQGWRTLILTKADAVLHPRYKEAIGGLENLPTVNDKTYELSCYLRWFSAVQAGCGTPVRRISAQHISPRLRAHYCLFQGG